VAFGFPAYADDEERYAVPVGELLDAVALAMEELGWAFEQTAPATLSARVSTSLWSWGERVTVRVARDGTVAIRSACRLVTQCFDWGKNRRNVNTFLDRLARVLDRRPRAPAEGDSHGQRITPADERIRDLSDDAFKAAAPPPRRPRPGPRDDAIRE
jgi:hypothetical protein